jgi:hypothetical protein
MTPIAILAAVLQYGPEILPAIQQIVTWIEGNKTAVTSADINLLVQLGSKKSSDYLADAGGAPKV